MGVPNRKLYLTNTNDETGNVLLSAWIPVKKEDGLYYMPDNTPIGLDIWVPNTLGVTYEEGPVPVKVVQSDVETGIWLLCVNDFFGNEQHVFTIKPIHKKEEDRFHDFKGWQDWIIDHEGDKSNCGFSLHVSSNIKIEAGDEPIPVTFERGHVVFPWDKEYKEEKKKECWLKRLFKKKKK